MIDDKDNKLKFLRRVCVDKLDRRKLLMGFERYKLVVK